MSVLRFDLYDLYQRMREIRERAGIRQADMAGIIGVDRRLYQKWESGQQYPSALHTIALLQILIGMEAENLYNSWWTLGSTVEQLAYIQ